MQLASAPSLVVSLPAPLPFRVSFPPGPTPSQDEDSLPGTAATVVLRCWCNLSEPPLILHVTTDAKKIRIPPLTPAS